MDSIEDKDVFLRQFSLELKRIVDKSIQENNLPTNIRHEIFCLNFLQAIKEELVKGKNNKESIETFLLYVLNEFFNQQNIDLYINVIRKKSKIIN